MGLLLFKIMETIFIDEKEVVTKYAERADKLNKLLTSGLREKEKETGVDGFYLGGLQPVMWSKNMDLETCISNLFAAFSNNYAESIFFQTDCIAKMQTLDTVTNYLISRGLVDDFQQYKATTKKNQSSNDIIQKTLSHERDLCISL